MTDRENGAGDAEVCASLLHLAACAAQKAAPEVWVMLEQDLCRRHPEKHAFWMKVLARSGNVPMRADLISVLLADMLADCLRAPVAVADPDSGPCRIGWVVRGGEPEESKLEPLTGVGVPKNVRACVSMRTVLGPKEDELAAAGLMPISLAYALSPEPRLQMRFGRAFGAARLLRGRVAVKLVHEDEDGVKTHPLSLRTSGMKNGLRVDVSPENMIYLMASEDALLTFESGGECLSASIPEPDGDPVGVRLHAAGPLDGPVRVSRNVFEALRGTCPWLGERRPVP